MFKRMTMAVAAGTLLTLSPLAVTSSQAQPAGVYGAPGQVGTGITSYGGYYGGPRSYYGYRGYYGRPYYGRPYYGPRYYGYGYRRPYYSYRYGYRRYDGGALAAGLVGGALLGSVIANARPAYANRCWRQRKPVQVNGRWVRRLVTVCNR